MEYTFAGNGELAEHIADAHASLTRQTDPELPADRFWFAALSSLLPQRRWHEIFPDPGLASQVRRQEKRR
ncbi:hypothetical protein AB0I53_41570 [Saccharopolyspora sp. NPDC050389]|uniref:hypothetical protein n=1 Tax=Saccharopolyspora sp. NPDC050389 TaxID=3155516 RepID=UPI0033E37DD8